MKAETSSAGATIREPLADVMSNLPISFLAEMENEVGAEGTVEGESER